MIHVNRVHDTQIKRQISSTLAAVYFSFVLYNQESRKETVYSFIKPFRQFYTECVTVPLSAFPFQTPYQNISSLLSHSISLPSKQYIHSFSQSVILYV